MARKSLRPHLNQIRTWTRQGRTDAWVAHQLEVTVQQIASFKRESGLLDEEAGGAGVAAGGVVDEEIDLRAEDDALIAAELEAAEQERREAQEAQRTPVSPRRRRRAATRTRRRRARRSAAPAAARGSAAARVPQGRSRGPSITARRVTGCGSTRPSPTTRSTPSTGPGTVRSP
ncbi:MAG: hypothetical protein ABSF58_12355 [Solirubrobacteraceae bacterium]